MDSLAWLQKAQKELMALAPVAHEDESDAWRAAVLIARLHDNPKGVAVPSECEGRLASLVAISRPTDPHDLLDVVAEELEADEDPDGPLLDALLDVDDAVGVTTCLGQADRASELSLRVAALVALYPERVLALSAFAEMRLDSLAPLAPIAAVWNAVERAPAHMLAASLPPAAKVVRASTPSAAPARLEPRVPNHLLRAAAWSAASEPIQFVSEDREFDVSLEAAEGRMLMEIRGERAAQRACLVAVALGSGAELAVVDVALRSGGRIADADLGPWAGSENLLHQLVARTGMPADELDVRLRVARD